MDRCDQPTQPKKGKASNRCSREATYTDGDKSLCTQHTMMQMQKTPGRKFRSLRR